MSENANQPPSSSDSRLLSDVEHREVLDIYAPLAHKLGLSVLKRELEDGAFAELHPDEHKTITQLVAERLPDGDAFVAAMIAQAAGALREAKLDARVHGRIKRPYSIYQKTAAGLAFDEIHDLVGIRVVLQSLPECYVALGALHARWKPVPGRFKDYIAAPKPNQYQSLHSTVVDPEGRFLELQICTIEMRDRAEHGVAAHARYKAETHDATGGMEHAAALLCRARDRVQESGGSQEGEIETAGFDIVGEDVVINLASGGKLKL